MNFHSNKNRLYNTPTNNNTANTKNEPNNNVNNNNARNNSNPFQNNPAFANLSPEKLQFVSNFANMKKPTQMQEMMPFLMSSMNQAKKENIDFSPAESDLLIELLKQNLSPAEAKKADMILQLLKNNKRSQ